MVTVRHWLETGEEKRYKRERETDRYLDMYHDHQHWRARISKWDVYADGPFRRARDYYETAYTEEQYDLIRWSLWALENTDYSPWEVWMVVREFWELQLGQTPLVVKTIYSWKMIRARMAAIDREWP